MFLGTYREIPSSGDGGKGEEEAKSLSSQHITPQPVLTEFSAPTMIFLCSWKVMIHKIIMLTKMHEPFSRFHKNDVALGMR